MQSKQIIIVTGCEYGNGNELVKLLSQQNDDFKIYALTSDQLIGTQYNDVISKICDVTKEADIREVIEDILKIEERIDIFVHCSNVEYYAPVDDIDMSYVKKVFDFNTTSFMLVASKIIPTMTERQSGHIIALSSMAGSLGVPFNSIYSASQYALQGYCESIQKELRGEGITVSLVKTGLVKADYSPTHSKPLSSCCSDDQDTNINLETFKQRNATCSLTMAQSTQDVAQKIMKIIGSPNPNQLRYITNSIYQNALCEVFNDQPLQI